MKKGRKKIQLDLQKVEQYAQTGAKEAEIAKALGCSIRTIQNRKKDNQDFMDAFSRGRAKACIFVGGKLMELIKAGNVAAIIFFLKCQGGWKETVKQEITGQDGGAIQLDARVELTTKQKQMFDKFLDDEF